MKTEIVTILASSQPMLIFSMPGSFGLKSKAGNFSPVIWADKSTLPLSILFSGVMLSVPRWVPLLAALGQQCFLYVDDKTRLTRSGSAVAPNAG
jgi:hypothetical protein